MHVESPSSGQRKRVNAPSRLDDGDMNDQTRFGDAAERREVRRRLRGLQAQVTGKAKDEEFGIGSNKFEAVLSASSKAFDKGHELQAREQLINADVLGTLSAATLHHIQRFANRDAPTPADFVAGLRRQYMHPVVGAPASRGSVDGEEEEQGAFDWTAMGIDIGLELVRPAVTFQTMVGPMEAEAPRRRVIGERRSRRDERAETVVPQELNTQQQGGNPGENRDTVTEAYVREMRRQLRRRQGSSAPLAYLLLSRGSFARTVEHMFALSFLVKEGHVELLQAKEGQMEEGGGKLIARLRDPTNDGDGEGGSRSQFIMRLDVSDWQLMKSRVPEGCEIMPTSVA